MRVNASGYLRISRVKVFAFSIKVFSATAFFQQNSFAYFEELDV
jgi:hypothetical protein